MFIPHKIMPLKVNPEKGFRNAYMQVYMENVSPPSARDLKICLELACICIRTSRDFLLCFPFRSMKVVDIVCYMIRLILKDDGHRYL